MNQVGFENIMGPGGVEVQVPVLLGTGSGGGYPSSSQWSLPSSPGDLAEGTLPFPNVPSATSENAPASSWATLSSSPGRTDVIMPYSNTPHAFQSDFDRGYTQGYKDGYNAGVASN